MLSNGTLLAAAALAVDLVPLLPLCVLIVAGDSIAGEANSGTLRYLLSRPVSRSKLLTAKLIAIITYVIIAVIAVAASGLIAGLILFPHTGTISAISGGNRSPRSRPRYGSFFAVVYVGISMLGVAAFAPAAVDDRGEPAGCSPRRFRGTGRLDHSRRTGCSRECAAYLPTHYWLKFVDLFRNPILWRDIERGLLLQAIYVAVFLGAAWAYFTSKDIKS